MLLLNLILLIEVTFSTPTPDYAQNPLNECYGLWLLKNSIPRKITEIWGMENV